MRHTARPSTVQYQIWAAKNAAPPFYRQDPLLTERAVFDFSRSGASLSRERYDEPGSEVRYGEEDEETRSHAPDDILRGDWSWKPCQLDPGRVWSADEVAVLNRENPQ